MRMVRNLKALHKAWFDASKACGKTTYVEVEGFSSFSRQRRATEIPVPDTSDEAEFGDLSPAELIPAEAENEKLRQLRGQAVYIHKILDGEEGKHWIEVSLPFIKLPKSSSRGEIMNVPLEAIITKEKDVGIRHLLEVTCYLVGSLIFLWGCMIWIHFLVAT
jgi:hypothetical protein